MHFVYPVLASRLASHCAVPDRLAYYAPVSHSRHRRAWRLCLARRAFFLASAHIARTSRDLKLFAPRRRSNFGVKSDASFFFEKNWPHPRQNCDLDSSPHPVEISVETKSPAKCEVSKHLLILQAFLRISVRNYLIKHDLRPIQRNSELALRSADPTVPQTHICTGLQHILYSRASVSALFLGPAC